MSQLGEYTFELIWQAIKGWDIQREPGRGYAHATGDDVRTVVDAIAPLLDAVEAARLYRQSEIAAKDEFYGPDVRDQRWLAAMAKKIEDQEELDAALAALERSDA